MKIEHSRFVVTVSTVTELFINYSPKLWLLLTDFVHPETKILIKIVILTIIGTLHFAFPVMKSYLHCLNSNDLLPHEWKSASRAILKWKCYGFVSIIYWLMVQRTKKNTNLCHREHCSRSIYFHLTQNMKTFYCMWIMFYRAGVFVSRCKLSKTIENVWLYWNIGQFMLKENVLNVP